MSNNQEQFSLKHWVEGTPVVSRTVPRVEDLKVYVNGKDVSDMYDFVIDPEDGMIHAIHK